MRGAEAQDCTAISRRLEFSKTLISVSHESFLSRLHTGQQVLHGKFTLVSTSLPLF